MGAWRYSSDIHFSTRWRQMVTFTPLRFPQGKQPPVPPGLEASATGLVSYIYWEAEWGCRPVSRVRKIPVLHISYSCLLALTEHTSYEEESVNRSQMDVKPKTCDIRNWGEKTPIYFSTYPPPTLIHLSHHFTSASKPAAQKSFDCCLSLFCTSISTSLFLLFYYYY
jgi:hypothetical protein